MEHSTVRYRNFLMDNARWDGFVFREGDIVISTPPKCGTTWAQMICALLIFQSQKLPRTLDAMSPWVEMQTRDRDELIADLEAQQHRRFFKSHTPLDGLPFDERVTYICVGRDPRDAAVSFANHLANTDRDVFVALRAAAAGMDDVAELMPDGPPVWLDNSAYDLFWEWVYNPDQLMGLSAMFHHLSTFWQISHLPNVVLLHYDDLKADLEGQMRCLAAILGIEIAEELWPELVNAATFSQMRSRATEFAPNVTIWRDAERFFNRGTSEQWRDLLSEDDLRRYEARVNELADPELSEWVHRGSIKIRREVESGL